VLNALGQNGIGSYMKKRLGLFGVNLRDQSVNQRLAFQGSVDGSLATIDLSSASDTVAYALVMSLLPWPWFLFLETFRSETVRYKGAALNLEKFSSMGNAYTFELESLIFWALTASVRDYLDIEGPISIFGDDIICPVGCVPLLQETLTWCGFSINMDKSFWTGCFRESCGADWYNGFDVRPWYLKKEISDRSLFTAHNFFMRKGEIELAKAALSFTQRKHRVWGPDGMGDGHLLGSFQGKLPRRYRAKQWAGVYFKSWKGVPCVNKTRERQTDSLLPSYSVEARTGEASSTNPYTVRGTKRYKKTSLYTTRQGIFRP
jgi:hypothetical protein